MHEDNISDTRILSFLQKQLATNNNIFGAMKGNRELLKGIQYCGSRVVHVKAVKPAVFLVKDDEKAHFALVQTCRSAWACPRCTAKVMAQKGTDIACLIEALEKWKQEYSFMVTFTLPHLKDMSCNDTYQILLATWRQFTNTSKRKRYVKKNGESVHYNFSGRFRQFQRDLEIKNMVRVYEFTWGKNSWHPHIHVLMWTKKKHWNKILDYEKELQRTWWQDAKKCALKHYNQKYPDNKEENLKKVENIFADFKMEDDYREKPVYISKDEHGKAIIQTSSMYVSGWTGEKELTGSTKLKRAKTGHYTPYQIIQAAYDNRNFPKIRDDLLRLFIEYAVATRGHRRVEFSNKMEARELINKWKQTQKFMEEFKKNVMDKGKKQVVCWFDEFQWSLLSWKNDCDNNIKATLLEYAMLPNAKQLIASFLENYDIKCHFEPYSDQHVINIVTDTYYGQFRDKHKKKTAA